MKKTIIGILTLLLFFGMTGCAAEGKGAGETALKRPQTENVTPAVSQAETGVTEPPASPPCTAEPPLAPDKMLKDVVERMEDYRFYTGFGRDMEGAKIPITSKKIKRRIKEYLKNVSLQKTFTMTETEEGRWGFAGLDYDWMLVVQDKNGSKYVVREISVFYETGIEGGPYSNYIEDRIEVKNGIDHTYYMMDKKTDYEKMSDMLSRYVGRQLYGKTVKGRIAHFGWPDPPFQEIELDNPKYGYIRIRCKNVEGLRIGDEVKVQFPKAKKKNYYLSFKPGECILVKQIRQVKD